ncbi:MAG TPA: alpha/beta hydrolase [Verrucomicrobiae bacterium]|nr:alpha/beta hydrolase [Verrucomicrobiae bacterium]
MTGSCCRTFRIVVSLVALAGSVVFAEDKPDIEYGRASGTSLRLDAHVPDGAGPFPVVLMVHGGGWSSGDKHKDVTVVLDPLTKTGEFTWFSINYRMAPTNHWPACFEDVQTAIRWVKAHAAEYKGDPQRMALMGYSAGGQLVCLAAVLARDNTRVQAVVGFSPPTDMVADTERRNGLSKSLQMLFGRDTNTVDASAKELLNEMSPIEFVKPGLPPFLFVQGDADKTVPYEQTLAFMAKLKENGVTNEMITIKGAPHRITEWDKFDPGYHQKLLAWLEQKLAVKK